MVETNQISLQDVVVQSPGYIVSDMGGEKVMMSVENGKYYNLREIGGRIWTLIEKSSSVSNVVDSLVSEYEVDRVECESKL